MNSPAADSHTQRGVGRALVTRIGVGSMVLALAALLLAACGASSPATTKATGPTRANYGALLKTALAQSPSHYEGPTTPAKAPVGIKIAAITCDSVLQGCVTPTQGIAAAASAIGWQERTFDGGGTAAQQNAQILNAIAWGAKVIAIIAINPVAVQEGLAAAKKAGVLVVSGSSGLSSPNPTVAVPSGDLWPAFDIAPNYAALGEKVADWIIANSHGKANIVVYSDREFPSVLAVQVGLLAGLAKCHTCTVHPLQYFVGSQVGPILQSETVAFLRDNPAVDYLFSPYDPAAAAQVPAIAEAGFGNRVKVIGILGDSQNLGFIKAHHIQAADGAYDNIYMGYAIVDQTIRLLDKLPLAQPIGENLPFVVLDSSNLPPALRTWTASFPYRSKFLALWRG